MLETGTILAGYRIDGVLGQGGMGVVYEATQLSLNRKVALKLLAVHLSDDVAFREPPPQAAPECSDGIDNDGGGEIDYPNDPQCTSPDDPSEAT